MIGLGTIINTTGIIGVGLNPIRGKKIRVANLLPAIVLAVAMAKLCNI